MRRWTRPREHVLPGNPATQLPSVAAPARELSVREEIWLSEVGLLVAVAHRISGGVTFPNR